MHLYTPVLNSMPHSTTSAWWRHRSMTQATSALYPHSREQKTKFIVRLQQQPANADAGSTGSTDKARSLPSWRWQLDEVCLSGYKHDMSENLRKLHSTVQGKFVFRLNWAIKAYEGVEVYLHRFFIGTRWSERSDTPTGRYKPGGSNLRYPLCRSRHLEDEISLFRNGKITAICRLFHPGEICVTLMKRSENSCIVRCFIILRPYDRAS